MSDNIIGNIHSYESFGTVDGPGIRFVIFAQGCPLRCLYCHNPDTWHQTNAPIKITPEELLKEVLKYKTYFQKRGGVTFSGGEPLLQAEFVNGFFKICKTENIHTAIDTSGYLLNEKVKEALQYTDLVLLDIKTINQDLHPTLTGIKGDIPLTFLDYLQEINKPVWIRHVVVPTLTDDETDLEKLAYFLKKYAIVEKIEILPYHTYGKFKYEEMNIEYPLKNIVEPDSAKILKAREIFKKQGFIVN